MDYFVSDSSPTAWIEQIDEQTNKQNLKSLLTSVVQGVICLSTWNFISDKIFQTILNHKIELCVIIYHCI